MFLRYVFLNKYYWNYILRLNKSNCGLSIVNLVNNRYSTTDGGDYEDVEEQFKVRRLLYPSNLADPLLNELRECASVNSVFETLNTNQEKLNHIYISQAVLVLWDLQKIFYKHYNLYENSSTLSTNYYIKQIKSHPDFTKLLQLIETNYEHFSPDALTCMLLYLNRMGVELKTNVMQLMIAHFLQEIKQTDPMQFSLSALSRFIVTVFSEKSLWSILVSIDAMQIIIKRLNYCKNADDFKMLTISLNKMHQLVSDENLTNYKQICELLINNGLLIPNEHYRTIIKSLRFLTQHPWHKYHSNTINKLLDSLKGHVHLLSNEELFTLFKVFQSHREPASLLTEIEEHASKLLKECHEESSALEEILELLTCIVSNSPPTQREKYEKLLQKYLKQNVLTPLSTGSLYKILYHLKSNDKQLCDYLWDKSLEFYNKSQPENQFDYLLTLCLKYTRFINVTNNYRNKQFETVLITLLKSELKRNLFAVVPSNFARIASFLIAFNENDTIISSDLILQQMNEMIFRFNALDCLNISKSIEMLNRNCSKLYSSSTKLDQLTKIELNRNPSLLDVNLLLKAFVCRKGISDDDSDELFTKMIHYHLNNNEELLSTKFVKNLTFALNANSYLMPEALDKLVNYIINRGENLLASTVDKVLYLCYYLGYYNGGNDFHIFLDVSSNLIIRDKKRLSGLSFVQACLSLCYYQHLPQHFITLVFSVEFLEELDAELSNCYAQTTYPQRVREQLMQLNRSVCLDCPESNVPWFHQKYLDELLQKQSGKKNVFHNQVHATLNELLKEWKHVELQENIYTPYGYRLNFQLNESNRNIAIILLNTNAYTNGSKNLKGSFQLKRRHLEILGYQVLFLNYNDWKLLYTQECCIDFIKNKLFNKKETDFVTTLL